MSKQKNGSRTTVRLRTTCFGRDGFRDDNLPAIRQTAFNLLSRRDHTKLELELKLLKRGHAKEHIQTILAELDAKNLLNERRFTENFIRSKTNKGLGPDRIRSHLLALGIPDDMIAEQLTIADNDWSTLARATWQKHFKGNQPKNYAEKAKQMRFLQYRGFTRLQICQLFDDEEI